MRVNSLAYPVAFIAAIVALMSVGRLGIAQSLLFGIMMYVILAEAVNILFGFTGYLPLGLGAFFGVGAYTFAILVTSHNWDVASATVMALLISAGTGALIAPLTRLKGPYYGISSLVMQFVISAIIVNLPKEIASNVTDISLVRIYNPNLTYVFSLTGFAVALAVTYYVKNSKYGLAFRAIKDDEQVAAMAGVKTARYRAIVSIIAAVLAGYAGILYGWFYSFLYPEAVFDIAIPTLATIVAIFGGLRTVVGPVLGAAVLYTVQVYLSGALSGAYILLWVPLFAVFLILIVLFLPHGIMDILYKRFPSLRTALQ